MSRRVFVTGVSAICSSGRSPEEIWLAVSGGRSAIGPIRGWDAAGWPARLAGEVRDFNPRALVEDRKLHKLLGRGDFLGLHAGARALEGSGILQHREKLDPEAAEAFNDRSAVFVGSGAASYQSQYDFLPLLARAAGDLQAFGAELESIVSPMWLLRTLPNNVLCHLGIRSSFKGTNACITSHGVSGALALAEAAAALRSGEADRALAVAHCAPVEPQNIMYYHSLGLLDPEGLRPFDGGRQGTILGEGAAALLLETELSARSRGAEVFGELLGSGCAAEGEGLLSVREDGDGVSRAVTQALAGAGLEPKDVGFIVAHGSGTGRSDASEARAIIRTFGARPPPVTSFKWAFGNCIDAAGLLDSLLALRCLAGGRVPAIPTFREPEPECEGLHFSRECRAPRAATALVLSRGLGGVSAALLLRYAGGRDS